MYLKNKNVTTDIIRNKYDEHKNIDDDKLSEYIKKQGHYSTTKKFSWLCSNNDMEEILAVNEFDDYTKQILYRMLMELERNYKNIFINYTQDSDFLDSIDITPSCYFSEIIHEFTSDNVSQKDILSANQNYLKTVSFCMSSPSFIVNLNKAEEVPIWKYIHNTTINEFAKILILMHREILISMSIDFGITNNQNESFDANAKTLMLALKLINSARNDIAHDNSILNDSNFNDNKSFKIKKQHYKIIRKFYYEKFKIKLIDKYSFFDKLILIVYLYNYVRYKDNRIESNINKINIEYLEYIKNFKFKNIMRKIDLDYEEKIQRIEEILNYT